MADRSKADIEAEIAAARSRLASNVEGLIAQVHPQAVKTRAMNDAKDVAAGELNAARSQFVDDAGDVRWEQVAYAAAAVIGTIAFLAVTRSLLRRH